MAERTQREPKDLRYRNQFFPEAKELVFDTREKGFIPLPIVLRKLMRYLSAPELRVLIYLSLRASKYGICYPNLNEMVHDLGLSGAKHLTPHLKSLEEKHFISVRSAPSAGKKFYLVHNPRVAIESMVRNKQLPDEELFTINELLEDLNQKPVHSSAQNLDSSM